MTDFLSSLKADLLDRRLLPILAVLSLALLAAVAYAAMGGGSAATPVPGGATTPAAPPRVGVAVKAAPTGTSQPVAETTSGSSLQRGGATRNPFVPLPGAAKTASSSSASSSTGSSSSGSSSSSSPSSSSGAQSESESTKSSGGTSPSQSSKPAPVKPKTVYHVAVLFGILPAGTLPSSAQLTPYENLTRQQPLPDDKQPLIVFRGVIAGGKSATFTLVGEAILRGSAACLPSASQCQAIDLKPGQSEELEYTAPGGAQTVYQLQVASITSSKASASAAGRAFRGESKSGLELLRHVGLTELPGLRYSGENGVLVFAHRHGFLARVHVAALGAPAFG